MLRANRTTRSGTPRRRRAPLAGSAGRRILSMAWLAVATALSVAPAAADSLTLVSHAAGRLASGANDTSVPVALSADGRVLLFPSLATDLVPGFVDGNGEANHDLYVYDRDTGAVALVSHAAGSPTTGANAAVGQARLSRDGRTVLFESLATDLVAGFVNNNGPAQDLYLYDRTTGTVTLVTHAPGLVTAGASRLSLALALSADGRVVLFGSFATNLVPSFVDANTLLAPDLYLYDRDSGAVALVSHAAGLPTSGANHLVVQWALSDDGQAVLFTSFATNLVPGFDDRNGDDPDVFLYERGSNTIRLVSHAAGHAATGGNGGSLGLQLSADGGVILLVSAATNLVAGFVDGNEPDHSDVFLYDRDTDALTLVSHAAGHPTTGANQGLLPVPPPWLSQDGRVVVFGSLATDLVAGFVDNNDTAWDVFLYDRTTGAVSLVSHAAGQPTAGSNDVTTPVDVSVDGRVVLFASLATNLVPGFVDGNDRTGLDLYLYDRAAGTVSLVSHAAGSPARGGNGPAGAAQLSRDGRFVLFGSVASDLVGGFADANGAAPDLYLHDRVKRATRLVSHAAGLPATGANAPFGAAVLSGEGQAVLFASLATDLVPGFVDANGATDPDVYLWTPTLERRPAAPGALVPRAAAPRGASGPR